MIYDPRWANAISGIESSGRYSLLGPVTKSGDRAYGKYQVMGNNVAPWTREALGHEMTPQDFLNDPAAQDAVFKQQFSKNVEKYGSPQDAASVWFTGRPIAKAGNASDMLGTTAPAYVAKFNKFMGEPGVNAINEATHTSSGGASMPFETTPPPDNGFLGQLGLRSDFMTGANGGYGLSRRLGRAGAALMAIDNPRGAATINQGIEEDDMLPLKRAAMAQKAQEPQFEYDPRSGTFFRTVNGQLQTQQNPNAAPAVPAVHEVKPSALKELSKNEEKYGAIAQISSEGADVLEDLSNGKLDLGMLRNLENSGRNMAGMSNEQSRAYARYKQFIQKLANTEMLKANGVQTEGDAFRVMQEIAAGGANYDTAAAKEAIAKLLLRNKEAVTGNGRTILNSYAGAYGADNPALTPFVQKFDGYGKTFTDIDSRLERLKKPSAAPAAAPAAKGGNKTSTGVTWSIN